MNATETIYTVRDERGVTYPVFDAERAERLSRSGLSVSATTRRTA
jgi:hypothetical protein